jgi:hypothetical protein
MASCGPVAPPAGSENDVQVTADVGYWSADNNFGETHYTFWLHETLRNLCGVVLMWIFMEDMTEKQKMLCGLEGQAC